MIGASLVLLSTFFNDSDTEKIILMSKKDNQVMSHLKELCYTIGGRPTGSPELQKAEKWAEAKFKSFGYKDAHLEKWGDVPVGFQRGKGSYAKMVKPFVAEIQFTTNCWMPGTNGPTTGPVVIAPKSLDEFAIKKGSLKGAWVLMDTATTMRGANRTTEDAKLMEAIEGAGILGLVYGSRNENVHTHGNWTDKTFEKRPKTVEIEVRKDDWDRLFSYAHLGDTPSITVNAENIWIKGPIAVHNVIAELKGTEKPDEVVVVGGHLDSWNSPGSQGACDNGTGTSGTLEAARLLMKSGIKPKRTIRFILWTGEEQGLLGSRGYVEKHLSEMEKISACIVDDGGSNYQSGASGYERWRKFFEPTFNIMNKHFPDMPQKFNAVENYNASGGSDQASFYAKGVPAFYMSKSGKQNYGHIWHTQFDRYEEAVPEYCKQFSTNLAVLSLAIANADTMLPRS